MDLEETQEEMKFSESSEEGMLEQVSQETVETEQKPEQEEALKVTNQEDKGSFVHGLAVGLGLGCISTFIIVWIAVFFTPQIPSTSTYESLLSIFIYPMLYLLAVGLVALTAGIVREYYVRK